MALPLAKLLALAAGVPLNVKNRLRIGEDLPFKAPPPCPPSSLLEATTMSPVTPNDGRSDDHVAGWVLSFALQCQPYGYSQCVFAEVFIHVFPKGLAFVERLQFAGQQSLDLPAPPPKQDSRDWRVARQAWEDGGRQGFIEVRTDFSEASHGFRDAPPLPPVGFACGTAA